MYMNWNKFLLYSGVIEVVVGLFVFLFVSSLVGIIILLVGLVDLGFVFFWPSIFRKIPPDGDESPLDEE
jgi:hypothetical protein